MLSRTKRVGRPPRPPVLRGAAGSVRVAVTSAPLGYCADVVLGWFGMDGADGQSVGRAAWVVRYLDCNRPARVRRTGRMLTQGQDRPGGQSTGRAGVAPTARSRRWSHGGRALPRVRAVRTCRSGETRGKARALPR